MPPSRISVQLDPREHPSCTRTGGMVHASLLNRAGFVGVGQLQACGRPERWKCTRAEETRLVEMVPIPSCHCGEVASRPGADFRDSLAMCGPPPFFYEFWSTIVSCIFLPNLVLPWRSSPSRPGTTIVRTVGGLFQGIDHLRRRQAMVAIPSMLGRERSTGGRLQFACALLSVLFLCRVICRIHEAYVHDGTPNPASVRYALMSGTCNRQSPFGLPHPAVESEMCRPSCVRSLQRAQLDPRRRPSMPGGESLALSVIMQTGTLFPGTGIFGHSPPLLNPPQQVVISLPLKDNCHRHGGDFWCAASSSCPVAQLAWQHDNHRERDAPCCLRTPETCFRVRRCSDPPETRGIAISCLVRVSLITVS